VPLELDFANKRNSLQLEIKGGKVEAEAVPYEPTDKSPCFQGLSEPFRTPLQHISVHRSSRDPKKPIEKIYHNTTTLIKSIDFKIRILGQLPDATPRMVYS
jgi:hypothetical protein